MRTVNTFGLWLTEPLRLAGRGSRMTCRGQVSIGFEVGMLSSETVRLLRSGCVSTSSIPTNSPSTRATSTSFGGQRGMLTKQSHAERGMDPFLWPDEQLALRPESRETRPDNK